MISILSLTRPNTEVAFFSDELNLQMDIVSQLKMADPGISGIFVKVSSDKLKLVRVVEFVDSKSFAEHLAKFEGNAEFELFSSMLEAYTKANGITVALRSGNKDFQAAGYSKVEASDKLSDIIKSLS